jgi:CRP-like cAMP-binding protein
MEVDISNDTVCAEEVEQSLFWFDDFRSKLQKLLSAWLKTFVIQNSSENVGEWRFRTLFVAEITMIPIVLSFLFVFWWVVNRNVRLRKTKGSSIPLKEDQGDELTFDSEDDDYNDGVNSIDGVPDDQTASHAQRPTRRQKTIQALMKAYNVELDDDEHDDETMVSLESYLEDSDGEEGPPFTQADKSAAEMFLSKEKLNLWKIVKEIPVFSFLNQEAMESCIHDIEYVTLDKKDDFLWEEGKFDGSMFYVVKGRVRVNFLDFKAPYQRAFGKEKEVASVVHVEDSVVTSQLAMIEGMIRYYLGEKASSLGRFFGSAMHETTAQTMVDNALLLRIPPSCFSRILDRYPETMLRIIQTTLNRTQRVTVQTLVRCCGLRSELLVSSNKEIGKSMLKDDCSHWNTLQNNLTNRRINCDKDFECMPSEEKHRLMKNACGTLANILNIEELGTIEVLEEKCSLVSLDGSRDDSERTLLKAGSNHDSCYLLLQGKMEIGMYLPNADSSSSQLQNDPSAWYFQHIRTISPGSIFGESALFTTDVNLFETRLAPSPECGEICAILLQIPLDVYAQVVTRHPQAMATLLVPVLTILSPVVHFLAWTTEWIHVEAAGEIVQKGTPCSSLFIVLNGRLRAANRAKARGAGSSEVIPPIEYGRGKIFGRVGSLANVNWPYDVFAIRQSELAKVPIKTIEVVVERFPYAGLFLARVIASDVASLHSSKRQFLHSPPSYGFVGKLSEHGTKNSIDDSGPLPFHLPSYGLNLATIAVVPLSYNIDLKRFCTTLSQAMETIAPCKLLTKSFVKRELGEKVYRTRNALHDVKMTRLLADLEENNRVVIYQADPKFTSWTRLCVLQADYIMLVVDSQEAPKKSRVEQTIAWAYEAMDVRIDLVVVGEEAKEDSSYDSKADESYDDEDDEVSVSDQLNNWSESRKWITGHHLVRAPFGRYRIDFHRMCRRISGRSIGLALGAGGARGIAHLGKSEYCFTTLVP